METKYENFVKHILEVANTIPPINSPTITESLTVEPLVVDNTLDSLSDNENTVKGLIEHKSLNDLFKNNSDK